MNYCYDVYHREERLSTTTDFNEAVHDVEASANFLKICAYDNLNADTLYWLNTPEEIEAWEVQLSRDSTWRHTAHSPNHYKGFIDDMQWIEAISKTPQFKDPKVFKGALLLMVNKYLDRLGMKDDDLQELKKAQVYLGFLIEYTEKGELKL